MASSSADLIHGHDDAVTEARRGAMASSPLSGIDRINVGGENRKVLNLPLNVPRPCRGSDA